MRHGTAAAAKHLSQIIALLVDNLGHLVGGGTRAVPPGTEAIPLGPPGGGGDRWRPARHSSARGSSVETQESMEIDKEEGGW